VGNGRLASTKVQHRRSTLREFKTAARKAPPTAFENAEPIEFSIDGETFTAYPPSAGQLAMLTAAQADSRDVTESMAAIIDFLDGMLDEDAQAMYRRRLLDRDDPFDFDTVNDIVEGLIEEWSARPTKSPSVSSPSRKSAGSRSTARPRSRATT
jgi:hypothetical protein